MLSRINSTAKAIWGKMRDKEYRDAFISAHISNTISAQIHAMRKARNWTQSELALRCDMKQSRISALEGPDFENVEISTLQRLASAFDVALSVRFVPFSEIAKASTSMTHSDFRVADFSGDSLAAPNLSPDKKPMIIYNWTITGGDNLYNLPLSLRPHDQTNNYVGSLPLGYQDKNIESKLKRS